MITMKKLLILLFIPFAFACGGDNDDQNTELYVDVDMDGFSEEEGDCNDNDSEINPNATDICDGVDNNCDGQIDEDLETLTYFIDNDNDGFGDINNSIQSCVEVDGYVSNSDDCDDNNSEINPNATDICDEVDNNCDGQIDDQCNTPPYISDVYLEPNNPTINDILVCYIGGFEDIDGDTVTFSYQWFVGF